MTDALSRQHSHGMARIARLASRIFLKWFSLSNTICPRLAQRVRPAAPLEWLDQPKI